MFSAQICRRFHSFFRPVRKTLKKEPLQAGILFVTRSGEIISLRNRGGNSTCFYIV
jgi:hypothetical protein